MILENLRKAGRAEHAKDERLSSTASTPTPALDPRGRGVHRGRRQRRSAWRSPSAPSTAPSAREQIKEAAKEAVQGVGFDLLVVCGFAFDPHVAEEAQALRQADGPAGHA